MKETGYYISDDSELLIRSGWSEFVHSHRDGNFFQLPEAYFLYKHVEGYTPYVSGIINAATGKVCGILVSVLQKEDNFYSRLTARSIVWGGPLIEDPSHAVLLLKHYNHIISGQAIYSQFRNTFDCSRFNHAFHACGFRYLEHLNYLVKTDAETTDMLLSGISKSKVRQIKKGLASATISKAQSREEADAFYSLLKKLYREKVHKPLPPKSFFDHFYTDIVSKGLGEYLLIKHNQKVIGGILCPVMPGKTIYEWYIAGLDKEYKDQYPSILATWAAILYGQENGLKHFDFLGAGKPDADYGVREFKSKFGGSLVNYGRFEKIYQPLLLKTGTIGLKLYKYIKK